MIREIEKIVYKKVNDSVNYKLKVYENGVLSEVLYGSVSGISVNEYIARQITQYARFNWTICDIEEKNVIRAWKECH